jgi:Methyltransferase domain
MSKTSTLKKLLPKTLVDFWYIYDSLLEKEVVGSCDTLLDVGCGANSPVRTFSGKLKYTVGIDLYQPSIAASQTLGIHDHYECLDVLRLLERFDAKSFDCVVALDLIEHLHKEDGDRLLQNMEHIAKKKVVVFTPSGFLRQSRVDANDLQEHLSGWSAEEMRQKGYRVYGVNGWKSLRGDRAKIKFWPKWFWVIFSKLTQLVVQNSPEHAFQILCIKTLSSDG